VQDIIRAQVNVHLNVEFVVCGVLSLHGFLLN
jgi:hypothetical protein